MSCKNPYITAESSTRAWLITNKIVDENNVILNSKEFRVAANELSNMAYQKYEVQARLLAEVDDRAIFNVHAFRRIDAAKGIIYKENESLNQNVLLNAWNLDIKIQTREFIKKLAENLSEKFKLHTEIIDDANFSAAGKYEDGRVYINLAHANENTPLNVFLFPFVENIKKQNLPVFNDLFDRVKRTDIGKDYFNTLVMIGDNNAEENLLVYALQNVELFKEDNVSLYEELKKTIRKILELIKSFFVEEYEDLSEIPAPASSLNGSVLDFSNLHTTVTLKELISMLKFSDKILTIDSMHAANKKRYKFKVGNFSWVRHGVGVYMNNAGIKNNNEALINLINLFKENKVVELAGFTSNSFYNGVRNLMSRASVVLEFTPETVLIEVHSRDVGSKLKRYGEDLKRYTTKTEEKIKDIPIEPSYDEVFVPATKNSISKILVKASDFEDTEQKVLIEELSNLTGAPVEIYGQFAITLKALNVKVDNLLAKMYELITAQEKEKKLYIKYIKNKPDSVDNLNLSDIISMYEIDTKAVITELLDELIKERTLQFDEETQKYDDKILLSKRIFSSSASSTRNIVSNITEEQFNTILINNPNALKIKIGHLTYYVFNNSLLVYSEASGSVVRQLIDFNKSVFNRVNIKDYFSLLKTHKELIEAHEPMKKDLHNTESLLNAAKDELAAFMGTETEKDADEGLKYLYTTTTASDKKHIPYREQAFYPDIVEVKSLLNYLKNKFNVNYHIISALKAEAMGIEIGLDKTAFIYNGEVYFIRERFDIEDAAHEYAHIFLKVIKNNNPKLYASLLATMNNSKEGQKWLAWSYTNNLNYTKEDHEEEVMAKVIGLYSKEKSTSPSWFKSFIFSIQSMLSKYLGISFSFSTSMRILTEELMNGTTKINVKGTSFVVSNVLFNTRSSTLFNTILAQQTDGEVTPDETGYMYKGNKLIRLTDFVTSLIPGQKQFSNNIKKQAEERADELWKNKDPNEKLNVPGVSMDGGILFLTKEEYKEAFINFTSQGAAKGNLFHYKMDYHLKQVIGQTSLLQPLANKIQKLNLFLGQKYSWMTTKFFESIVDKIGLIIDNKQFPAFKDKLESEVKVFSETMGIGTTIDLFVEHFDGKFSLFDWKTARHLDTNYNKWILGNAMIPYTARNKAKLELLLRAVLLKTENPEIQFRRLSVVHVANQGDAHKTDYNADVNVAEFLPILESYYKINFPDVYAKMIAKSKNVFKIGEYVSLSQSTALSEKASGMDRASYLDQLRAELVALKADYDYALYHNFSNKIERDNISIENTMAKKLKDLTEKIVELSRYTDLGTFDNRDISVAQAYFGQYGDITNPDAQILKSIQDQAKMRYNEEWFDIKQRFDVYASDLLKEHLEKTKGLTYVANKLTFGKLNFLSYHEMFKDLYITNKEGNKGLIIKTDPEWKNLTVTQQKFLTFLQVTYQRISKEVLEKKINVTSYSTENLLTIMTNENQRGIEMLVENKSLSKRFFPKIPITEHEYMEKYKINKEYLKRAYSRFITSFKYETGAKKMDLGLPVKYLSTYSEDYSENLALGFEAFMKTLLQKKHLDATFALTTSYIDLLETKETANEHLRTKVQENLITFLKGKVLADIKKEVHETNLTLFDYNIDINKVESTYRKFISLVLMAVKPIAGFVSGGIVPYFINARRAVSGAIGFNLLGIDKSELDFTPEDLVWATGVWSAMEADAALGKIRENKTWLMLKKFKYLPSDFSYALIEDESVISRNPGLSSRYNFIFHTFWENANATITLLAQLHNMKLKNGTKKNVYEAYEVAEDKDEFGTVFNTLVWKGGLRGKVSKNGVETDLTELTSEEHATMRRVYQRMQGGYGEDERLVAETYLLGRIVLHFRKYLPTMILGAFGSRHQDITYGSYKKIMTNAAGEDVYEWQAKVIEGRYRILVKLLYQIATLNGKKYWHTLTSNDKLEVSEALTTIVLLLMSRVVSGLLFDDDEEDEAKKTYLRIAENMTQQYNFIDWFRSAKTSSGASLNKTWETGTGIISLVLNVPNAAMGKDIYTQEGNLKGLIPTIKGVPYLSSIYTTLKFFETNQITGDQDWLQQYLDTFNQ